MPLITLEHGKKFIYLGQIITDDGRSKYKIRKMIGIAKTNFIQMKDVLASRKLTLALRKQMPGCYTISTLLYALEMWHKQRDY